MDKNQAKAILARYRPGEMLLGDAEIGEALELARHDPDLADWLKKRTAQAIGEAEIAQAPPANDRIIPLSKPALVMIGVATALVLAVFIWSLFLPHTRDPLTLYRIRMVRFVQRAYPMQKALSDPALIRDYFRTNSGPVDFTLPRNLEKLPAKGCAVFPWHTYPVGLIQFDAGGNTNLDLFLIPRAAFMDNPVPTAPEYALIGKTFTATWTVGDQVYLLTGPEDPAWLRNFAE